MFMPKYEADVELGNINLTNPVENAMVNTDPRSYQRWEQVLGRSKHPLSTG
jgi:hypothetical protein